MEVVEPKLQNSADDFNTWCIDNNMGVHYGKIHAFVVGTKHMTSANEGISVTINKHCTESVNAQKHLGITIDKKLTWARQIDLVCRNVSLKLTLMKRKLTLMKLLSKFVQQNSLKQYYNSYVLPVFDFGCVVWDNTANANLTRLVKLQKRAARMILKVDFMTPSEQLFKELNWPPFPKWVQYHTCLMVYKSITGQTPEYIPSMLTYGSEHHERQTRSTALIFLHIPRSHPAYFDRAFSVQGPKLWNSLPADIRNSTSTNRFKSELRCYLLYYN